MSLHLHIKKVLEVIDIVGQKVCYDHSKFEQYALILRVGASYQKAKHSKS